MRVLELVLSNGVKLTLKACASTASVSLPAPVLEPSWIEALVKATELATNPAGVSLSGQREFGVPQRLAELC